MNDLWKKLEDQVQHYRTYKAEGDDDDIAPTTEIIDTCIKFLQVIKSENVFQPPHHVALGPNGTIHFTWESHDYYLEAEIAEPNKIEWMQYGNKKYMHWEQELRSINSQSLC